MADDHGRRQLIRTYFAAVMADAFAASQDGTAQTEDAVFKPDVTTGRQ